MHPRKSDKYTGSTPTAYDSDEEESKQASHYDSDNEGEELGADDLDSFTFKDTVDNTAGTKEAIETRLNTELKVACQPLYTALDEYKKTQTVSSSAMYRSLSEEGTFAYSIIVAINNKIKDFSADVATGKVDESKKDTFLKTEISAVLQAKKAAANKLADEGAKTKKYFDPTRTLRDVLFTKLMGICNSTAEHKLERKAS